MEKSENNPDSFYKKITQWMKTSITLKLILIGILILLLQIPALMTKDLIRDRNRENNNVKWEISDKWGKSQYLAGPIISIPYVFENEFKKVQRDYITLLPEQLNIKSNIDVKNKHRGIYNTPVYKADLNYLGSFNLNELSKSNLGKKNLIWEEASVSIGIPDMAGIQERVIANLNGNNIEMNPGILNNSVISSGVSNYLPLDSSSTTIDFNFNLSLNGSERIAFYPIGKETNVLMESNWAHPSFNGNFLPDTHNIKNKEKQFTAEWKVLNLNRNYPQFWSGNKHKLAGSDFGVEFKLQADHYQKTTRSAKYANMFIFLTFLIFFFIEVITKIRIHAIQYLLVGVGLMVFYTLLLSISEHYNFKFAYIISATAIIGLITSYVHSVFKKWNFTGVLLVALSGLYAFLFVTLNLESYSLLIGSIGTFIILGIVMFASRKVNWIK